MNHKINDIDNMTVRSYGEQALRDEAQAILDQISYMDSNFEKAVDMMYHHEGLALHTSGLSCCQYRLSCDSLFSKINVLY